MECYKRMDPSQLSVGIAFLAGLVSFLSPCMLPLVPIFLAQLVGQSTYQSTHDQGDQPARLLTFLHAVMFVLGFTLAFVALGATASTLGGFLRVHQFQLRQVGGILLIIIGLHLIGIVKIPFLYWQKRFAFHPTRPSYPASLLIGVIFAIGWTPCISLFLGSILGLGVSHRPALEARGIEMGNARVRLRRDTEIIRKTLAGETMMFGMKFRQPKKLVPIYYAALALETARLGGELADGLMLYLCTPERMRKSIDVAHETAKQHGRKPSDIVATVGLPVFLHNDLKVAYAAAQRGLAFYGALPFYNRLIARSGFESAATAIMEAAKRSDASAMAAAVTEPMIDSLALVGPESRCFERLEQYRT